MRKNHPLSVKCLKSIKTKSRFSLSITDNMSFLLKVQRYWHTRQACWQRQISVKWMMSQFFCLSPHLTQTKIQTSVKLILINQMLQLRHRESNFYAIVKFTRRISGKESKLTSGRRHPSVTCSRANIAVWWGEVWEERVGGEGGAARILSWEVSWAENKSCMYVTPIRNHLR